MSPNPDFPRLLAVLGRGDCALHKKVSLTIYSASGSWVGLGYRRGWFVETGTLHRISNCHYFYAVLAGLTTRSHCVSAYPAVTF